MRVNSGLLAFQPLSFREREPSLFLVDPKAGERGHEVESPETAAAVRQLAGGSRRRVAPHAGRPGQNRGFSGHWSCLWPDQNSKMFTHLAVAPLASRRAH